MKIVQCVCGSIRNEEHFSQDGSCSIKCLDCKHYIAAFANKDMLGAYKEGV